MNSFPFLPAWRPEVFAFAALLAISYQLISGRLGREWAGEQYTLPSRREHLAFIGLLTVFVFAVGSPLDLLAQTSSFPAYILQMLLMTMVMPWLLLLSLPRWIIQFALSLSRVQKILSSLTKPWKASLLYNLTATLSLSPFFLDLNLSSNWIHLLTSAFLMIAALLFWWPLVGTRKIGLHRDGFYEFRYIAYSIIFMLPIILALLLTKTAWYKVYLTRHLTDLSLLQMQQEGAKLMLLGMLFVFGTLGLRVLRHLDHSFWYNTPS